MTLLLDTHTFLWFWWNHPSLSPAALALIRDPANRKFVSPATPWEVAIKVSLKKLSIGAPYGGFFPQNMVRTNVEWLYATDPHFDSLSALPFRHRDPLDRLIIAQAMYEQLPVVSADVKFDPYPVRRLW